MDSTTKAPKIGSKHLGEETLRKPYTKPEVVFLQPLEAMANVCALPTGKASPGQFQGCQTLSS